MMKPVMPTYKAIVQSGRIVIDNVDFEDGTELELEIVNDNEVDVMDDEQRTELDAELDASLDDLEAGRTIPMAEAFAKLRAQR